MRTSVHSRPRLARAAAGVTVALTAAALAVGFGGTPASATEAEPSPTASATATTPANEPVEKVEKAESPTAPLDEPQFDQKATAQISGVVWDDADRDGIRDTDETPLADATVLIEPVNDGELPQKSKLDALTKTRSLQRGLIVRDEAYLGVRTGTDGQYEFKNIPTVPVRIWVAGPKTGNDMDWRVSPKGKGTNRALDSDFTEIKIELPGMPANFPRYLGKSDLQRLQAEQKLTLDAGLHLKKVSGSISGRVWNDRNRNGIQDAGEKGVEGLPVAALSERARKAVKSLNRERVGANPSVHLTTTDAKGEYSFPEVVPGEWVVAVGAGPLSPDGEDIPVVIWTFTEKDAGGDDAKDSDVVLSERFQNKAAISDILVIERDGAEDVDAGVFRDEPSESPSASPTTEPPATNSPSAEPAPGKGGGSLPKTGLAIGGFLVAGALLIGGGTALTLLARKRRTTL